ncbi:Clr5 domain-containing protein [Diaporthe sp. PMI_573]|nr:Clr5 domain-containing protein [Diaporthaceae sp. PMI_573]
MHHTTVSKKEAYSKPSQEEWEAVRLTIRQLYIDENKTLSEVSETLAKLYGFRASPKQYKNRFKQWGLWKNLSTRDAARLIQMKASRDSIGKTSTFVRAGQKLDFDRVQKTIRRSKNRAPKIAAEVKRPKLGQADPAPPACNQPSRVECRTPSPEPLPAKDGLDFLDSLDSSILRVDGVALDRDFSTFEPEAFLTHVSESFMISPSPFDTYRYEDPHVEMIWECYARVHHKLALRCEWLRSNTLSDSDLRRFRRNNSLLAILEPIIAKKGRHYIRELFLANVVSTFRHRPGFTEFAQSINQTLGQDFTDRKALSHHATLVGRALSDLGLQSYTQRFIIGTMEGRDSTESPPSSDENIPAPKIESPDSLSPDVNLPSPGTEMPPTPPSCNDYTNGPDTSELEAAAFAYDLGEMDTAETRLRALTCYERSLSTKGQVLVRLALYCLSSVQRQAERVEEADGSLMRAIRGSTFYTAEDGTEWDEVSYIFM